MTRHSPAVRVVTVIAVLATAWHIFASFLWIAPVSPLREVVPGKALSSYMLPMFGQSWSVFAPEPINGDYRLEVRAILPGEGEAGTETDWVDATAVELSMIQYNPFPPRAGIGSTEVASQFKKAFDALSADHKVVAGLNYFEDEWSSRMTTKMKTYAKPELVDPYVKAEDMTLAYATQVARAVWGEEVQRVQFRVSRQNVIPFAKRHDPEAERPAVQAANTGWRGMVVRDGQSDAAFRDVFLPAYERLTR